MVTDDIVTAFSVGLLQVWLEIEDILVTSSAAKNYMDIDFLWKKMLHFVRLEKILHKIYTQLSLLVFDLNLG